MKNSAERAVGHAYVRDEHLRTSFGTYSNVVESLKDFDMDHVTGPDNEDPWFASPRSKHTDVLRGIGRLVDTFSLRGITAS